METGDFFCLSFVVVGSCGVATSKLSLDVVWWLGAGEKAMAVKLPQAV